MRRSSLAAIMVAFVGQAHAQESRTLTLEGVSVYESADLLAFAGNLAAQRYGVVAPSAVAEVIETIYLEDGHFLADAWVSADGSTIIVDEGEIGSVQIEGVDARTYELVRGLVDPVIGVRGVTQAEFERALMLVEDVESISALAEIEYIGDSPTANLRIIATPVDTSLTAVTIDNPARAFGEVATISFIQQNLSLLVPGDLARVELSYSGAFDGGESDLFGALTYRAPLGTTGAYGEVYASNLRASRSATGALVETDVAGLTAIAAVGFPFIRSVDTFGYGLVEYRRAQSEIELGNDTFDSGVDVIGASWIYSRAYPSGGVMEYGLNLSYGTNDDVGSPEDGDETFSHIRFGFGFDRPLPELLPGAAIRAEIYGQYSGDDLPGIERFYLGSRDKERGYASGEASGDTGVSLTVEIGRDLFPDAIAVLLARPFGFFDAGIVRINEPVMGEEDEVTVASAGLGVDLVLTGGYSATAHLGVPLLDGPETDRFDPAVYVALTKEW